MSRPPTVLFNPPQICEFGQQLSPGRHLQAGRGETAAWEIWRIVKVSAAATKMGRGAITAEVQSNNGPDDEQARGRLYTYSFPSHPFHLNPSVDHCG